MPEPLSPPPFGGGDQGVGADKKFAKVVIISLQNANSLEKITNI